MGPIARLGRWTLLSKFTVLSLICFALLGTALAQLLARQIQARALSNSGASAQLLSDVLVRTQLRPGDMKNGLPPERSRALDRAIDQARARGRIARVKIWSPDGRIVYSDNRREIGNKFEIEEDLEEALGGEVHTGVAHGEAEEQRGERELGQLLEAYVPLRFAADARPAGAFEIYLPYAPVARAASRDVHAVYLLVAGGMLLLYLLLYRIVGRASRSLRRQSAENRRQALHDPLTGLANRRALQERMDRLLGAGGEHPFSVLMADLDGFKELNDALGHQAGDAVLTQLGPRLRAALPDVDLLARIGGDEFAVVTEAGAGRDATESVAERLRTALAEPFIVDGISLAVQASVGIARFPDDGTEAGDLLQRVDAAMYQAKALKAGWLWYEAERDDQSRARLTLASELRRAVSDGELVVYYQPKADLATGDVGSVEALVRWNHPRHGLLAPGEFLPMVEQTGLIRPLTLYVLDRAVSQLLAWDEAGLELNVAVNLARANLLDERLPDDVEALLERTGLAAERLTLEISENVVMADPTRTVHILGRLRALRVGLSLDDFGVGHSSLSYLRQLRVDELKIDRSFVTDMQCNEENAAIVRSTIDMAHAMGLRVVAEGVEDVDTLFELKAMGTEVAQGFYLSRPVPATEIAAMLAHAAPRLTRAPAA